MKPGPGARPYTRGEHLWQGQPASAFCMRDQHDKCQGRRQSGSGLAVCECPCHDVSVSRTFRRRPL